LLSLSAGGIGGYSRELKQEELGEGNGGIQLQLEMYLKGAVSRELIWMLTVFLSLHGRPILGLRNGLWMDYTIK